MYLNWYRGRWGGCVTMLRRDNKDGLDCFTMSCMMTTLSGPDFGALYFLFCSCFIPSFDPEVLSRSFFVHCLSFPFVSTRHGLLSKMHTVYQRRIQRVSVCLLQNLRSTEPLSQDEVLSDAWPHSSFQVRFCSHFNTL